MIDSISWQTTKEYIEKDFARLRKKKNLFSFLACILTNTSFCITFWFRIGNYLLCKKTFFRALVIPVKFVFKLNQHFTGIQIQLLTDIRGGINFKHFSCIVFALESRIGENCTFHQGVTIGRNFAGVKTGCPTLGNNVIVFPGAKVVGNIKIGNNVIIGANAVVVNDVPDNSVVAGNPAKVISTNSSNAISDEWKSYFNWQN